MLKGDPAVRLVFAGGACFVIDSGVVVDLDALAVEERDDPKRRRPYPRRRPAVRRAFLAACPPAPRFSVRESYFARFGIYFGHQGH